MSKGFVLISSGGTGGHMSPAAALARVLKSQGYRVELVTDTRGMKFTGMFQDVPVHLVRSGTTAGGLKGKVKGIFNLLRGLKQGFFLVRGLKPDVVVGFGGYPSVPAVLMAQVLRVPTIIHEQNAVLGLANKILAPRARKIALSLPIVKNRYAEKSVVTGNPIRPEVAVLHKKHYVVPGADEFCLLVMGGSLGASVFSAVVPQAVVQLPIEYQRRLRIVQQARAADIDEVQRIYERAKINFRLAPFIEDIATQIAAAHLIIGRSGASTVAELSAAGRPAIFVPYPHHKDQQQRKNAQGLADYGGAWVMEEKFFTQEWLLGRLKELMDKPELLGMVAARAHEFGKPDAAERLAGVVVGVLED